MTRSATLAISRLWVTTSTVTPLRAWSRSSSRICTPVRKSSSPVGSSASSTGLPVARARAMATRCCSPPESWWGKWPVRSPRPTRSSTSSAPGRSVPSSSVTSMANCTFSRAVSAGNRLKVWNTKLTVRRRNRVSSARVAPCR